MSERKERRRGFDGREPDHRSIRRRFFSFFSAERARSSGPLNALLRVLMEEVEDALGHEQERGPKRVQFRGLLRRHWIRRLWGRFFPLSIFRRRQRRRGSSSPLSHFVQSTPTKKKQNARATMAPHEAPADAAAAAAGTDQKAQPQPHPRPSSGSELTKENATAGMVSNESLTVRERSMHLLFCPLLVRSPSLLQLTPA